VGIAVTVQGAECACEYAANRMHWPVLLALRLRWSFCLHFGTQMCSSAPAALNAFSMSSKQLKFSCCRLFRTAAASGTRLPSGITSWKQPMW